MARNLLNLEEVSKAFDIRALLERVSLGISEGDRIGIVGRNGSGKSTLMKIMSGAESPDAGRVTKSNETNIGLFPDVGGGFFLSRLPGHMGEWLALTGHVIGAADAIALGLADCCIERSSLSVLWEELRETPFQTPEAVQRWVAVKASPTPESHILRHGPWIDAVFSAPSVREIMARLSEMSQSVDPAEAEWASSVHTQLSARSPLMLHVVLEQVRRARQLSLADDLAMERVMVHQCFYLRPGAASETVEGVRALAVDKDHQPKWNPARIEDVTPEMVAAFFESPWTPELHPMVGLLGT